MTYNVLFKLLLSQIPKRGATKSNGLLKCEPSQRIWKKKKILLSTVTKTSDPSGAGRSPLAEK